LAEEEAFFRTPLKSVRTRCGRNIDRPVVDDSHEKCYSLVAHNGNVFACTTEPEIVTCIKCKTLIGVFRAKSSRPADPEKQRAVERAFRQNAGT
jgi:hypothetical protein